MIYHIENLLGNDEVEGILSEIMLSDKWIDGNSTANYGSDLVKKNIQVDAINTPNSRELVENKILNNPTLKYLIFPKKIHNLMFTRAGQGMFYKSHTDNPSTAAGRRDISFTLFLNKKENYQGGELIMKVDPETKSVKLDAGQIFFYPTKYIHEVKEVVKGERIACVGWIESDIKNNEDREILTAIWHGVTRLRQSEDPGASRLQSAYHMLYKKLMQ